MPRRPTLFRWSAMTPGGTSAAWTCSAGVACPYWAKDIKVGFAINAKAEGIETKPAFREAFQRRRCLVPIDNFYEWAKTATGKQPYAIALADRRLMALAGLWENWKSPEGEWMRSFAIITTTPNELCAPAQPHACGPETRSLAALARGGAGGSIQTQGVAGPNSVGRDDLLAGQRAGRQRQE
jgi:hypothetical protein